jgi:hypothetical protein
MNRANYSGMRNQKKTWPIFPTITKIKTPGIHYTTPPLHVCRVGALSYYYFFSTWLEKNCRKRLSFLLCFTGCPILNKLRFPLSCIFPEIMSTTMENLNEQTIVHFCLTLLEWCNGSSDGPLYTDRCWARELLQPHTAGPVFLPVFPCLAPQPPRHTINSCIEEMQKLWLGASRIFIFLVPMRPSCLT